MIRWRGIFSKFVGIVFYTGAGLQAASSDWPQFLGPTRNLVYHGTQLAPSWPREGPRQVWKREVGEGFSGPVVSAGKLILFHRLQDQERVECLEAATGKSIWSAAYPTQYRDDFGFDEGPRATPAIESGRVYTVGAEGKLHCWNLADGSRVWSVDTKEQFSAPKGFFGMACSPLIEGDLVVLTVGGSGGTAAFDKGSGKARWQAPGHETAYSSPTAATIQGGHYLFVFSRAGLAALETKSGRELWRFPWRPSIDASVNAATPLVFGDRIFISTSYGRGAAMLKFGEKEPAKVWSGDDILSNHYATSVHHDGFLYGFDGRQEYGCNLRCVDAANGEIKWNEERFGAGTVMVADGRLLILSERGELIQAPASPKKFEPAARAQILGFEARAYPALAGGLFFARDKRRLICVDLRAGR